MAHDDIEHLRTGKRRSGASSEAERSYASGTSPDNRAWGEAPPDAARARCKKAITGGTHPNRDMRLATLFERRAPARNARAYAAGPPRSRTAVQALGSGTKVTASAAHRMAPATTVTAV